MDITLIVHELIILLVVVGFIFVLSAAFKKYRVTKGSRDSHIQVIQHFSLSQKDKIVLLKVLDQHLVVGMSSAGMRTLHVFDKELDATVSFESCVERVKSRAI